MADKKDPMTAEELNELLADGEVDIEGDDDDDAELAGEIATQDEAEEEAGKGEVPGDGDGGEDGTVVVEGDDDPAPAADLNEIFQIPKDAKTRLEQIETEIAAAEEKWDAGDIGDTEFKRSIKELNAERAQISARIEAAQVYATRSQAEAQAADDRRWKAAVDGFKAANGELWKDEHRPRFNEHVKAVTADPRYASMTFDQQLRLAANFYVSERAALDLPAPKLGKAAPAPAPKPGAGRRPPLPQTLAHLPAAEMTETGNSRFSHIEAMEAAGDVEGAEEAVARLSAADRAAYLRGE